MLKLYKIDVFDLYVPIVEDVDYPIAFEDAKDLVKKATLPLGEEYQKLLDRAFAERWVDVYENDGKQSGAFSCGVFGVHPYVLMNYDVTLGDAPEGAYVRDWSINGVDATLSVAKA